MPPTYLPIETEEVDGTKDGDVRACTVHPMQGNDTLGYRSLVLVSGDFGIHVRQTHIHHSPAILVSITPANLCIQHVMHRQFICGCVDNVTEKVAVRCAGEAVANDTNVFACVGIDNILLVIHLSLLILNIKVEVFWNIF